MKFAHFKNYAYFSLISCLIFSLGAAPIVLFNKTGRKIRVIYLDELGSIYGFDLEPEKNQSVENTKKLDLFVAFPEPESHKTMEIDLSDAKKLAEKMKHLWETEEARKKGISIGLVIKPNMGADSATKPYNIVTTLTK